MKNVAKREGEMEEVELFDIGELAERFLTARLNLSYLLAGQFAL